MASDKNQSVLVYDVGGSHISAAEFHSGDQSLGPVVKSSLSEILTSNSFVDALHSLGVQASGDPTPAIGAGFAMPGPFDYKTGVSHMQHKLVYLYELNVRDLVAQRFGWQSQQVRFINDAAAYLMGEVAAGAATGVSRAVAITLGTGVGSAFAVDGRIVTEGPGVAPGGEVWNVPYEGGIVEDLISTRALQKSYRERTGKEREVASMAHYAVGGEPAAEEVFAEFGTRLGQVLRHLFSEFAPDVIVLGGGISRSAHLFLPSTQAALGGMQVQLRITKLADNAPLVGAGAAWFASEQEH